MLTLAYLPTPDAASFNSLLQPIITLGLVGLGTALLVGGVAFGIGYVVYMSQKSSGRSSSH